MQLDLTEEETLALLDLLNTTVEGGRYPVLARIRTIRGKLAKLGPMAQVPEEQASERGAVGTAEAELDRRELERELRAVPTGGELDREVLERQLLPVRAGGGRSGVGSGWTSG
jgi:hypothetical protein